MVILGLHSISHMIFSIDENAAYCNSIANYPITTNIYDSCRSLCRIMKYFVSFRKEQSEILNLNHSGKSLEKWALGRLQCGVTSSKNISTSAYLVRHMFKWIEYIKWWDLSNITLLFHIVIDTKLILESADCCLITAHLFTQGKQRTYFHKQQWKVLTNSTRQYILLNVGVMSERTHKDAYLLVHSLFLQVTKIRFNCVFSDIGQTCQQSYHPLEDIVRMHI